VFACVVLIGVSSSCFSGQSKKVDGGQDPKSRPYVVTSNSTRIQSVEGGKQFLNADGWLIPGLAWEEGRKTTQRVTSEDGKAISVDLTELQLKPFLITSEPFDLIESNIGNVQIQTARMYAVKDRVFCYRFQMNRIDIDQQTKIVRSSSGSLFFIGYYDEDGDGLFETLYLDEVGKQGIESFYNLPHLPKWVQKR